MDKYPIDVRAFIEGATLQLISIGCSNTDVYKITKSDGIYYLKIGKAGSLSKEYLALTWLQGKLSVPKCVMFVNDATYEYMITTAMMGEMSCSKNNIANPETTIKLLADAITMLQNLNILGCPLNSNLDYKLGLAEYNVTNNLLTEPMSSELGKKFATYRELLEYLKANRPNEELVFSHGDISLPNVIFDNGEISGFIDIGDAGVADKWFDIAIMCKSIKRNFKNTTGLVDKFLSHLNLKYNSKIDYYLAILDLYL